VDHYLPRELEKRLAPWMGEKEALLIKGPRQSGKTTLVKHLRDLYGGTYINLELPHYRDLLTSNPLAFAEMEEPLYFDEVSAVKGAGPALKLLYDEAGMKMLITGSGAFEVKENISSYMVGRAVSFELLPLSFSEFLLWRYPHIHREYTSHRSALWGFIEKGAIPHPPTISLKEEVEPYLTWGGFPRVVLARDKETVLANIVTTLLEKDVFFFFTIRDRDAFRAFAKELSARAGKILSLSNLGLSYRTAERYVSILSMEYVVELVPPFHQNLSTELRKSKKLFFHDLGILNALAEGRVDRGALIENFAFIQLRRHYTRLRYWRTEGKAEVDFVLPAQAPLPVEVKAGMWENLPRALRSFIKAYHPPRALVLTGGTYKVEEVEGTTVLFYPYWFL